MKKIFSLSLSLSLSLLSLLIAQNDTISIQAHDQVDLTSYGYYDHLVNFPEANSYEKILMDFTMGCATGGCSHWDYTVSVYFMEPTGSFDSTVVSIDTLDLDSMFIDTTWNVYENEEKFELGRMITPYGNYMDWDQPSDPNDLYDESWTHSYIFDVTDFAPLLTDTASTIRVFYSGYTSGFSATVDFHFISGTPAREVLSIENMYPVGGYSYESLSENVQFPDINKTFDENVKGFAIKTYVSGHGHEGPQNCCEWVSKKHSIAIDGNNIYQWDVWKDCGMIPIYPQGGTWPFDRAGWCPGTEVDFQLSELTDFIDFNSEINIDYRVQSYIDNGEQDGTFIVSNTMFSYGAPNFNYDIEIIDIIKPSKKDKWKRMNPICTNPIIEIRNRGGNYINSASIQYGIEGQNLSVYDWTGTIEFMQSMTVELPSPDWTGLTDNSKFIATIILDEDEYPTNNTLRSEIYIPEVLPSSFVVEYRTQPDFNSVDRASQNALYLYDEMGTLLFEHSSGFEPLTWYRDTFNLSFGCYELVFEDSAEDGINEHWYSGESSSGSGIFRIRELGGGIIKKFPDDFGQQIDFQFTVDYLLNSNSLDEFLFELYPNPSSGFLNVNLSFSQEENVNLYLMNSVGEEIQNRTLSNYTSGTEYIDIQSLIPGIYYLKLNSSHTDQIKKFIILK